MIGFLSPQMIIAAFRVHLKNPGELISAEPYILHICTNSFSKQNSFHRTNAGSRPFNLLHSPSAQSHSESVNSEFQIRVPGICSGEGKTKAELFRGNARIHNQADSAPKCDSNIQ